MDSRCPGGCSPRRVSAAFRIDATTDLDQWDIDNVSVQSEGAGGCDRIVAFADLAAWETGATGPDDSYQGADCLLLDQNSDGSIDLRDIQSMQKRLAGLVIARTRGAPRACQ